MLSLSYGPIPLLCKEEYLFDRLGLSEVEDVNTGELALLNSAFHDAMVDRGRIVIDYMSILGLVMMWL